MFNICQSRLGMFLIISTNIQIIQFGFQRFTQMADGSKQVVDFQLPTKQILQLHNCAALNSKLNIVYNKH